MGHIERPILENVNALRDISEDLVKKQSRIEELEQSIDFKRILFPINKVFYVYDKDGELKAFVFSISPEKEKKSHSIYELLNKGVKLKKTSSYSPLDIVKLNNSEQYYLPLWCIHRTYFFHTNPIYDLFSWNVKNLKVIKSNKDA